MMKMRKYISLVLMMTLSFGFYSCGNSNVSGSSEVVNDVAFDPSKSSNLEVAHYNVMLNRLLVDFDLENDSQAVTLLNQQQTLFKIPNPKYTATYGVQYTNVFALACEEMADASLFPDGADMDHAWETLTGKKMDAGSQKLESDILAATAGRPLDEQIFSLCFAVAMDANTIFINFVAGE
jgi:hypothetical protein